MTDGVRALACALAAFATVFGTGTVVWFILRKYRDVKSTMFRAGQLHGAQIAVDKVKAAIDGGVDIENLRRGLDTEELAIAEMVERLSA